MRLILKHLLRSIGKKPIQPIILILTMALAIATSAFTFTIGDTLKEDVSAAQLAKYGNADMMIGIENQPDSRFLFAKDVEKIIGEEANIAGIYELPLIVGNEGKTAIGMATEFESVGEIFSFEFISYGRVTEGTLSDVAFVSEKFASEHFLSVGDSVECEIMGQKKSYRVEGIAKQQFLASYDVMVDISSITRIFANNSLLFAAIGDSFKPCGRIFVDFSNYDGGFEIYDAVQLLKQDLNFSDKDYTDVKNIERRQTRTSSLDLIVDFAVALAAVISAVVTFSCFYILSNERAEENLTLAYSGAGPRILWTMQYTEILIYWLLGLPLGILFSLPLNLLVSRFVKLRFTEATLKPLSILKGSLIILAVALLTTTLFIVASRFLKKTGNKHTQFGWRPSICLLAVLAVLFGLMYLLPSRYVFYTFVLTTVVLFAIIFVVVPPIFKWIAYLSNKNSSGEGKRSSVAFKYAVKNLPSLKIFHNIARLSALVFTIIYTIGLIFFSMQGQISTLSSVFNADYAVLNATDSCYEKTLSCESVDEVYRIKMMQSSKGIVMSVEDVSLFSESLNIERLPVGNEVIVSISIAHTLDLEIGDDFILDIDGHYHNLVVGDVRESAVNYFIVDAVSMKIPYNMLLVKGRDGVSNARLLGELSESTSSELAAISTVDKLLESTLTLFETYFSAGKILIFIFAVFSVIGMIDTVYESSRSRREEFGLYTIAGMNKKRLFSMKLLEVTLAIGIGLAIGILASVAMSFISNAGLSSKAMEIFIGVKESLR